MGERHNTYPHAPGRLESCHACTVGSCVCTDPEHDTPCVSINCTHPDASEDWR